MTRRRAVLASALVTIVMGLATVVPSGAVAAPVEQGLPTQGRLTQGLPEPSGLLPTAIAGDFDAGNIIADTVFFDPGTMNATQVQQFLSAQGATCIPNSAQGNLPCLKDIQVATVTKTADGLCTGYTGGLLQSAAQIIVGVASSCNVNPRVLIVLLEKEQSLVTRHTATNYAYERATGFGCPDSAPCNTEYFGLFNQLYLAARQYQKYAAFPEQYPRYRPGRLNAVLYHPNPACGSSDIFIANQATAGLYTYTPYQPNAAALANLYGTGDGCSTYGNRNFWRLFTDWFGSTQGGGFLVRTVDNATVYLVSGSTKYPVPSYEIMAAYAPLGPVGYVSQLYLDRRTTGQTLSRLVTGPDRSIYLVDNGRRHWVGTCTMVADFGGVCGALAALTDVQIGALTAAANLRPTVRTGTGRTYYITDGTRREVADTQSLVDAGLPTSMVDLTDAGISWLTVADPVIRPGIVLHNRASGQLVLNSSTSANPLPQDLLSGTALGSLPQDYLDNSSMARIPVGATLSPFVRTDASTALLMRGSSITELTDPSVLPATTAIVGTESLARFTATGPVGAPLFIQPVGDALRYQVVGGARLPVRSDAELTLLGGSPAAVLAVTPGVASLIPVGRDAALTQFNDVRITDPFAPDILWLVANAITTGYPDGTFRPAAPVTREAMAAFLYRQAGSPPFTPPSTPTFADVPTGHPFFGAIEWLATEGISTGTRQPDGTVVFLPGAPVSREAMAAFLYRRAGSPAFTPPATPTFTDVSADHPFVVAIEWLASVGVTTGNPQPDGTVTYAPRNPVSREAMAAFLHRFSGL